jgi:hypothetical protein
MEPSSGGSARRRRGESRHDAEPVLVLRSGPSVGRSPRWCVGVNRARMDSERRSSKAATKLDDARSSAAASFGRCRHAGRSPDGLWADKERLLLD